MDIKITKARLLNVVNYDWVKMILAALAIIAAWSLIFTTTATRITDGQAFYLTLFEDVYMVSDSNNKLLAKAYSDGDLSFDVLETHTERIQQAGNYSAFYMLTQIRMTTKEADVLIIGGGNEERDLENKNLSSVQSLASMGKLYNFEEFLDSARAYCVNSKFIVENEDGYTVNAEEIRKYFVQDRIVSARNYRKTYISDEKIEEGVKGEIARIEKIYTSYLGVKRAIEKAKEEGNDILWYTVPTYFEDDKVVEKEKAAYGIDLGKLYNSYLSADEDKKEQLSDLKTVWYTFDEEGQATMDGLVMAAVDFSDTQHDLQYEDLSFIYNIIRNYSTYGE
ncbi:MAG: hypothetical protein IJ706_05400 [Clostridia bacterium]|nr:hypothetical protein [Clostridia bacterium]